MWVLPIAWSNTGVVRPYLKDNKVIFTPTYVSYSTRPLICLILCATRQKEADSISDVVDSASNRMSTRSIT